MSEFIVLGFIPGTQIQITFALWIVVVSGLLVAALGHLVHRTHLLRNWIVTIHIVILTRQRLQV